MMENLYLCITNQGIIAFSQEFEALPSEKQLAVLNQAMDLIMAKTGQVIDSLEVQ